jgi:8-oxo-dGTP pyrophosphatase MutT (NUDIX family)
MVAIGDWIGRGEATASDTLIQLDVFAATIESGEVRPREHARFGWFDAAELRALDWAAADVPVLPSVLQRLGRARRV